MVCSYVFFFLKTKNFTSNKPITTKQFWSKHLCVFRTYDMVNKNTTPAVDNIRGDTLTIDIHLLWKVSLTFRKPSPTLLLTVFCLFLSIIQHWVQADWSRLLGVGVAFIFIGLIIVMVNRIITAREEEELTQYVKQRLSRTRWWRYIKSRLPLFPYIHLNMHLAFSKLFIIAWVEALRRSPTW